jgi:hypothetical protein
MPLKLPPPPTETVNGITCQKMFRFYNPYTYEHLYTTDVKEAADLRSRGWNAEGIGWYSPIKDTPGVVKIYRLYNPYGDDHLYTTEVKEKDDCIKRGWKLDATFEAYGFISKQLGAGTGISRLFNPYEKYHTHLFSANKKELEDNIKRGWRDEQVRWYVPGKPAEATPAVTDTDVNVSTGSGSSSSHEVVTPSTPKPKPTPKPVTPTPTLSPDQQKTLTEIQKPVRDLIAAARTNILKGAKTPDEAIQALQTKATKAAEAATTLGNKVKDPSHTQEDVQKAAIATRIKEEADFRLKYAKDVKALNEATDAKNEAQKKVDELSKKANQSNQSQAQANSNTPANNSGAAAFVLPKTILMLAMASTPSANTPPTDQTNPLEQAKQALEEAKKHETEALNQVLADENEIFPLTYTVHFINDRQGRTGDSRAFKDRQVTIYTCIAKQKYALEWRILNGAAGLSYYTEAKAVDGSLAQNDASYNHVESTDKYPCSRVRYDKEHNRYTVEFVKNQGPTNEQAKARWASQWKTHTVKPDPNNKTGLPELNMSIMGLDTKLFHATDSDSINTLTQAIAEKKGTCSPNGVCKLKFDVFQTEAARKMNITREFEDTEGGSLAAQKLAENEQAELWKEAVKHSEYKLPDAITSATEPNVSLQITVYKLKKAEREYNEAKKSGDVNAQLKARKDAISAAMQIMDPLSDVINVSYTGDTYNLIYVRDSLLGILRNTILEEQAPADTADSTTKANYQKYVNAFVTWMNDQTDANKEALKAAEIAYRGKSRSWELKDVVSQGWG